ncbi:MAG: recombination protein RecO [Sulfurimonas sp.]|uniref:recombination protein RecO n=1 Tax=Sulfurimonas sp. TaxID=2022749 RepID=UPI002621CB03|nr:recombination protein RecO [Sulfurimonas sp.]MDD2653387.1 recombination protein RecO [Sulfurimonas sp.]MDD3451614.1 recombination protein RecO [Sulfurimonas sp.]
MQGFIVNLNRVKDEDLIVTIISRENLDTLYRFYGARHGVINLGFKIDYEKDSSSKATIHRLKDVIHIGFRWIGDYKLLRLWQDFCSLFYKHLKDTDTLDTFYFDLLENASQNWNRQNPKRVAIESYIKLLEHEGRLHKEFECFLCSETIEQEEVAFIRAYLPTHKHCSYAYGFHKVAIAELFEKHSSLFLSDTEVDRLWTTLLEGI